MCRDTTNAMDKKQARLTAKSNISKLTGDQKEWASGAIADALSGLDVFRRAHKVFVYLGTQNEPNTEEIVGLALMAEKVVCVPRVYGDEMKAIAITPFTNFKTNKWGILEPVGSHSVGDPDLAIVPMVAFDGLNRVGHGKGYYDRYLACHDCFVLGLAFDCQEAKGLEISAFDHPLDMLVTEKRIVDQSGEKENPYFGKRINN